MHDNSAQFCKHLQCRTQTQGTRLHTFSVHLPTSGCPGKNISQKLAHIPIWSKIFLTETLFPGLSEIVSSWQWKLATIAEWPRKEKCLIKRIRWKQWGILDLLLLCHFQDKSFPCFHGILKQVELESDQATSSSHLKGFLEFSNIL